MNKKLITLLTLLTVHLSVYSQDTLHVSKQELLGKIEQNLQIKIAQKQFQSAQSDYNQSNALFLPNITASHTAMATTNPLMAFGSKLNQEILTMADFNPALLNDPDYTRNYATKIEVQMPLINVDGWAQRSAAKAKMDAYSLQTERTKQYLQLEVSKAYMQLQLAYRAVEVLTKANNTAQANLKMVQQYFNNGMLQKTDLLNVQIRVNEIANQWQYAQSNIKNASDYLSFLINETQTNKIYKPSEALNNSILVTPEITTVPQNRKDVQAMEKSTEAYLNMFSSSKFAFLPRLNAFGSYELYDQKIFKGTANGYLIGAQLSWNVFDGFKSIAKMQKSKADYQKAQAEQAQYLAQNQLELNKTNRQLKDAENKVHLSKLAFEQSQEAYRIRENRFKQGLEKTTDLLMSETQVAQKELEYLQAVFEYNFTQQYIQFLTQ